MKTNLINIIVAIVTIAMIVIGYFITNYRMEAIVGKDLNVFETFYWSFIIGD